MNFAQRREVPLSVKPRLASSMCFSPSTSNKSFGSETLISLHYSDYKQRACNPAAQENDIFIEDDRDMHLSFCHGRDMLISQMNLINSAMRRLRRERFWATPLLELPNFSLRIHILQALKILTSWLKLRNLCFITCWVPKYQPLFVSMATFVILMFLTTDRLTVSSCLLFWALDSQCIVWFDIEFAVPQSSA